MESVTIIEEAVTEQVITEPKEEVVETELTTTAASVPEPVTTQKTDSVLCLVLGMENCSPAT